MEIKMSNLKCVFAENKYGSYCVPKNTKHRPASKTVINGGIYEPETIQYILDNRGDGVVVHAGTFFGDFLPAISGKGKRVYAFEPVFENYRCAKVTLDLNFEYSEDHNTYLYHAALGTNTFEKLTMKTVEEGKHMGGGSRVEKNPKNSENARFEVTNSTTIDFTLPSKNDVSIIQLDVEGFEEEALKGAVRTLRKSKPILILEILDENMLQSEFFTDIIFGELGYKEETMLHRNIVLRV
jgi:FkbM family methyltransferase